MILAVKSTDILIEGILDHGLAFMGDYLEKMLHRTIFITDGNGMIHFPDSNSSATIDHQMLQSISSMMDNEYYYEEESGTLFYRIEYNRSHAFIIVKNLPAEMVADISSVLSECKLPIKCYFSKLNNSNERFEKELADYLFTQSHANLRDILHLSKHELDINWPYMVLIVQIEEKRAKVEPSVISAYASEYLKREKMKAISVYNDNLIALIIPVYSRKAIPEMNITDNNIDILTFKQAIDSKFKITSSIGIGQFNPLIELEKSFTEARIAIILNHLMGKRNIVQKFSQLGVYQPIFSQDIINIREFSFKILCKLIKHDCKSDGELLPTLRKLLDACVNIKATADSLFIHVNTLYYRINKIEQILEIDLAKMDTRVELHTAIKVWDTLQILEGKKVAHTPDLDEPTYAMQA